MVGTRITDVTKKSQMSKKLTNIFLEILTEKFLNILNIVFIKTVEQRVLIITKI